MDLMVAVVTLWADDFEGTVKFYKQVLGMKEVHHESEGIIHFKLGDILFTVMKGKPAKATDSIIPRFPIIAFSVEDIQRSADILQENEMELPLGIKTSLAAKSIMLNDPSGNLI